MRKFAIVIFVSLALGGCANLGPLAGFIANGAANPVTPEMVYRAEQAMIITVSGLNAYKQACISKAIAQNCRATVAKLQTYTRPAAQAIKDLRLAVRTNDQVTAVNSYNLIIKLMNDFKSTALAAGVS